MKELRYLDLRLTKITDEGVAKLQNLTSLQTLNLLRDREWLYAGGNVLLSVVLCMIAVWLGYLLGAVVSSLKGN